MSVSDELQKLQAMRDSGALTEEEFGQAKTRLLSEDPAQAWAQGQAPVPVPQAPVSVESEDRQWGLFIHLSQFVGFIIPFGGIIAPLVLWQMKKDVLPSADAHGKIVLNWAISVVIYAILCIPLIFVIIGIPLLILVGLAAMVFPVIGAIKANDGVRWVYPMSIPFLK